MSRLGPKRLAMAAGVVLSAAASVLGYPKPAAVAQRWELQFEPGPLRLIVDKPTSTSYWYFTYKVTNRTGHEQVWAPRFTLFTDAGEILTSGRRVPGRVTADIMELLGNELLENQNQIIGEIFYGREHAKEGLVVWPALNVQVNELSMFVEGLSGEKAAVRHPITATEILLSKTLQRDYLIRGNAPARGSKPIELVGQSWVMR